MNIKKMLVATGSPEFDAQIRKMGGFEFVPINIGYKNEVCEACHNYKPDILIVTEKLSGSELLTAELVSLKQKMPSLRIIYLAGEVDLTDMHRVNKLGAMVLAGIYDIICERKLNIGLIEHTINNPKDRTSVEYLLKYFVEKKKDTNVIIEFEDEIDEEALLNQNHYKNVYMISSIKPGSGKSFVASCLATAIARFGEHKGGNPPRVAIIEADLQTLSLGTLLAIEDDKVNLKTVMEKIATIITPDGDIVQDEMKINAVNEYIISSFKQYSKCKNLYALVGSQLTMEEIEGISPYYYSYLVDIVSQKFDVVIIDSNSSLLHVTTYPLLSMVNNCYYVLNLDYNNVRNNNKYRNILKKIGVYDKVKYILNEDFSDDPSNVEKLQFDSRMLEESFELEAKIPSIHKSVFLNRLWEATPIVLDDTVHTLKARYELTKVANQMYPMDNLNWLEREVIKLEEAGKKKGFFSKKK